MVVVFGTHVVVVNSVNMTIVATKVIYLIVIGGSMETRLESSYDEQLYIGPFGSTSIQTPITLDTPALFPTIELFYK